MMVTQNIKGTPLVNGMLVYGIMLVMDDHEPADADPTTREWHLHHVPLGVIVSTTRGLDAAATTINDLSHHEDVFFVPQTRRTFAKGGGKGSRKQIPLMPALALTVHKAQGLTLPNVILDFVSAPVGGKLPSRYVALSRTTRMDGIRLLGKPANVEFVKGTVPDHLRREDARLQRLGDTTRSKYVDLLPPGVATTHTHEQPALESMEARVAEPALLAVDQSMLHDAAACANVAAAPTVNDDDGADEDREYNFEAIVGHKDARNDRGKIERMYTVRFEGFGPADDLPYWASDLRKTAKDAVDAYEQNIANRARHRDDDTDYNERTFKQSKQRRCRK
jgi:hypothetical protein